MEKLNIYKILAKEMIREAFEADRTIPNLEKDVSRTTATMLDWKAVKGWKTWFASLYDQCENFREEKTEDVDHAITSRNYFDVFYGELKPHLVSFVYVELEIAIEEDEENEEEVVTEQVKGEITYWFNSAGWLDKIEIEEQLTGERWELWPELEDFTTEIIFIDRTTAEVEDIG